MASTSRDRTGGVPNSLDDNTTNRLESWITRLVDRTITQATQFRGQRTKRPRGRNLADKGPCDRGDHQVQPGILVSLGQHSGQLAGLVQRTTTQQVATQQPARPGRWLLLCLATIRDRHQQPRVVDSQPRATSTPISNDWRSTILPPKKITRARLIEMSTSTDGSSAAEQLRT